MTKKQLLNVVVVMLWYLFRGEAEQDVIKNYVHIFPFVDLVWFYQYLCNRSTFCYMVSGCLAAHSNNYEICIFQHRHTHTHTIICSLDSHACMHMHAGTHTHTHTPTCKVSHYNGTLLQEQLHVCHCASQ